jgi:hypothetical protein
MNANKDYENKDYENKDYENKDYENKDYENKDYENKDYAVSMVYANTIETRTSVPLLINLLICLIHLNCQVRR